MKSYRLASLVIAILLLLGARKATAQQEALSGGWGTLSSEADWQRIENGTTADLSAASALVSISRQTYGKNPASNGFAGSGGFCFDIETGGPTVLLVEQGILPWSFYDQQGTVDNLPITGLALLSKANDGAKPPVIVAPDSRLQLEPGDMMVSHHGTSCSLSGNDPSATFLQIQGFSTSPEDSGFPQYGIEVEALDPEIGLATARSIAPSAVMIGRLTLPPGEAVTLDASTMPVLFTVEQGTISVTTSVDGGIIMDDGIPSPLRPETTATFATGGSGYIPPGPQGTVTNTGNTPAVAFSVAIIPSVEAGTTLDQ